MALGMGGGRALPKFGEWDGKKGGAVPQGFTAIFEKARHDKKSGAGAGAPHNINRPTPPKNNIHSSANSKHNAASKKKRWFCWW